MFRLIKQVFIALLSFGRSLSFKCVPLNNEPCVIMPTLIDLNPVELKCYPFMISLDEFSGSCNFAKGLSAKICFPSKTKDVNVKVFNIITNKNEAKTIASRISCDCKCKFNSKICSSYMSI